MGDYRIVTERASIDVTTRPGIPGLRVRVTGVQGAFRVTLDDDGRVDLDEPTAGAFSLTACDLRTGGSWITARVPWLGDGDRVLVGGRVVEVRPRPDGRFDLPMTLELGDRTVRQVGTGSIGVGADGALETVGGVLCDPRSFGVPLPPLITWSVFVRWRLPLEPLADGSAPHLDEVLADRGR